MAEDKDIEWFKLRYKVMLEHGKLANLKPKDFEYEPPAGDFENDKVVRLRKIEKQLDNREDLAYDPIPNSHHYLEADPNEKDSHSIGYAGGYRV